MCPTQQCSTVKTMIANAPIPSVDLAASLAELTVTPRPC